MRQNHFNYSKSLKVLLCTCDIYILSVTGGGTVCSVETFKQQVKLRSNLL